MNPYRIPSNHIDSVGAGEVRESVLLPLAAARRLPPAESPRMSCRYFETLPRLLPNGLPRLTAYVAGAWLVVGGVYLVTVRVLRDGPDLPPSLLEMNRRARDLVTGSLVLLPPFAPELIRAAYDEMARRQVLANARQAALKGRN